MIVTSSGDAGDCIFLLNILRSIPEGPHSLLIEPKDSFTATGRAAEGATKLCAFIKELCLAQPYVSEVRVTEPVDRPQWRSGGFRQAGLHKTTDTLLSAHLNHYNQTQGANLAVDTTTPWLSVSSSKDSWNRVVINRTHRYNNPHFPWGKIVGHFGPQLLFIGLPHEHLAFCDQFGPVDYQPTADLLEMAQLIKGSDLFIGNQSCANALAEGLKHPSIQETSLAIPDCIFKRDNAQYVWDGSVTLPASGEFPATVLRSYSLDPSRVSTGITPPGLWQYPYPNPRFVAETYPQLEAELVKLPELRGKNAQEIKELVQRATLERLPHHYRPLHEGGKVIAAMLNAGYEVIT